MNMRIVMMLKKLIGKSQAYFWLVALTGLSEGGRQMLSLPKIKRLQQKAIRRDISISCIFSPSKRITQSALELNHGEPYIGIGLKPSPRLSPGLHPGYVLAHELGHAIQILHLGVLPLYNFTPQRYQAEAGATLIGARFIPREQWESYFSVMQRPLNSYYHEGFQRIQLIDYLKWCV